MPVVKFFPRLDLSQICRFMDRHKSKGRRDIVNDPIPPASLTKGARSTLFTTPVVWYRNGARHLSVNAFARVREGDFRGPFFDICAKFGNRSI